MSYDDMIKDYQEDNKDDDGSFDSTPMDFSYGDLLAEQDVASTRRVERVRSRPQGIGKKIDHPLGVSMRLLPGRYTVPSPDPKKKGQMIQSPAVPYKRHWIPFLGRFIDCLEDKCVVCHYLLRRQLRDVGTSLRYMMTVFSTDSWHEKEISYVNKQNQKGSYKDRVLCEGPGCVECATSAAKAGWWTMWDMTAGHYKELLGHLKSVANKCASCQDRVYPLILMCGLGDCTFNIDTITNRLKSEDIEHYLKNPTTCPTCNNRRKMREHLGCFDDRNKVTSCTNPERTNPYMTNLRLQTRKEQGTNFSTLHLLRNSKPHELDFVTDFPEWPKEKVRPMNLMNYRFTITPELQADLIGMPNPFVNTSEV